MNTRKYALPLASIIMSAAAVSFFVECEPTPDSRGPQQY